MKVQTGQASPELIQRGFAVALISLLTGWLYFPYLSNPLVFDDGNLFYTEILTIAATAPWKVGVRGLPYFTVGWVETQIGSIVAHRLVSLAVHILVAYQMFRFLEEALLAGDESSPPSLPANGSSVRWIALLVATAFACHPVAVYGAGYLVQRTIVFATLFALLCLRELLIALRQGQPWHAVWAAVWASMSILSKEHAVMLPIAALALVPLDGRLSRDTLRVCTLFLSLCAPAMLIALLTSVSVIGQVYEPSIGSLESELFSLPPLAGRYEKWMLSASTQAQLYFAYWQQWLLPNSSRMSVDLRVDFLRPWTHVGAWMWILGLVSLPCLATVYSARTGRFRLLAFALTISSTLFLVELSTVRFQEPYVLYRSYLWSVGYCALAAALAHRLPPRIGLGALAMIIPILLFQATGRLDSFRSKLALWDDAATKLPKLEIGGSSRILFNRGGERFRAGQPNGALDDINQAIRLNPGNGKYRNARAIALLQQGLASPALDDADAALELIPQNADFLLTRSRALRAVGRVDEADAALVEAAQRGSYAAKYQIARKASPSGDITIRLSNRP